MAKVALLHPDKGVPGKRYWLVSTDPHVISDDDARVVSCRKNAFQNLEYVCRDGAMTMFYAPRDMAQYRLIEIALPKRADVLKEMVRRGIVKPEPNAPEGGLDFI
uniref:Uncharacterized protein n=1 Tax=Pseudomonas phage HRDY3 TaxID=3236930 RepID=A0AB39CDT0_9VIRU